MSTAFNSGSMLLVVIGGMAGHPLLGLGAQLLFLGGMLTGQWCTIRQRRIDRAAIWKED